MRKRPAEAFVALLVISAGLLMIVFGSHWSGALFARIPDTALGEWLSLVIPYVPLGVIGIGAALFVRSRDSVRAT